MKVTLLLDKFRFYEQKEFLHTGFILSYLKMQGLILLLFLLSGTITNLDSHEINLVKEDIQLSEALTKLSQKYEVFFSYDEKMVEDVEVSYEPEHYRDIEHALNQLLAGTSLQYKIFDNRYIILYEESQEAITSLKGMVRHLESVIDSHEEISKTRKNEKPVQMLNGKFQKQLQPLAFSVSGTVTDLDGETLIGVNIQVKGSDKGTATDIDGRFTLEDIDENAVLVVSYIGYQTQEIAIAGKSTFNITMISNSQLLDEVVVVGYGSQKKVNLTGAVSRVTSERLENRPLSSVGRGLQGLIPNLNISPRNGDPNQPTTFNIRGFTSINGGSPLILVDGIPMSIDQINPNDIKAVNVLKDASSAAVYGARAAFGVILIETKEAQYGKMSVTLSQDLGLNKSIRRDDLVFDHRFFSAWNEAQIRSTGQSRYDQEWVEGTQRYHNSPTEENEYGVTKNGELRRYAPFDVEKDVIARSAPQRNTNVSLTNSSDKGSYYVSFGAFNQKGYLKDKMHNLDYNRYNVLMKASYDLFNIFNFDSKISINMSTNDEPTIYASHLTLTNLGRQIPPYMYQFPDLPYYLEPGDHDEFAEYIGLYGSSTMKAYNQGGGRTTNKTNDIWLTQGVTVTPFKGFKIRSDFSYNSYYRDYKLVKNKVKMIFSDTPMFLTRPEDIVTYFFSNDDLIRNNTYYNQYFLFNTYGEYNLVINDNNMKFMIGFNQEWGINSNVQAMARSLITPLIHNISATLGPQNTSGGQSENSVRGGFYRFNYNYQEKYLFEANGRYDGTSRFPKDSRFGFFPSFSAAWRISNEPFLANQQNWLSNLKLRASYGELGNQLIGGNYPYIPTMGAGIENFILTTGPISTVSPAGLVSPDLTWETVETSNIGIDITLLGNKLDFSADVYSRNTNNMLMRKSYPPILGASAPSVNAADLKTQGWELSLAWIDNIGSDWSYQIGLSLADNQTEITKYENNSGSINDYYVGSKIGEIWGYRTLGIFQSEEEVSSHVDQSRLGSNWRPGDIKYADLNGDGEITQGNNTLNNPGDREIVGNSSARHPFGINMNLDYKNWSLSSFFQGLFRDYLPSNGSWVRFYPFNTEIIEEYYLEDTWSPENRNAYFYAPYVATHDKKNILPQSRWVQNASYIRLKSLILNYNIPKELIQKLGLERAQIYFSGANLWEYSKIRKPLDPESVFTLATEYYLQRNYSFGINIKF